MLFSQRSSFLYAGRSCWPRSVPFCSRRGCDCRLTHELDLENCRLLTLSLDRMLCSPFLQCESISRMQPWQSSERGCGNHPDRARDLIKSSIWTFKILVGGADISSCGAQDKPRMHLPLLVKTPPTSLEWPRSVLGLSLSSVYTGRFPISLKRLPRFQTNALSLKNFLQHFLQGKVYWQHSPFLFVWGSIRSSLLKGNFRSWNIDF